MGFHCSQQMDGQFCHGGLTKKSFSKTSSRFSTPSLAVCRSSQVIMNYKFMHCPAFSRPPPRIHCLYRTQLLSSTRYITNICPLCRVQYIPQYIRRYTAHFLTVKTMFMYNEDNEWKRDCSVESLSAWGPNAMLSLKTRDLLSEHSIQKPLMPEKYVKTTLLPNHFLWKDVWSNKCLVFFSVI